MQIIKKVTGINREDEVRDNSSKLEHVLCRDGIKATS